MYKYAPAKINAGLHIGTKIENGLHTISSLFIPITWFDLVEIVPQKNDRKSQLTISGKELEVNSNNLVCQAIQAFEKEQEITFTYNAHLDKSIPIGAGLGGGSSDAIAALQIVEELSGQPLSEEQRLRLARQLGSDCSFFVTPTPTLVSGTGECLQEVVIDFSSYYMLLLHLPIHISTQWAYEKYTPSTATAPSIEEVVRLPLSDWKTHLFNDFEFMVFKEYPILQRMKNVFYDTGAVYASMSGSGSVVYGLYEKTMTYPSAAKFVDGMTNEDRSKYGSLVTIKKCTVYTTTEEYKK